MLLQFLFHFKVYEIKKVKWVYMHVLIIIIIKKMVEHYMAFFEGNWLDLDKLNETLKRM